MAGGSTFFFFFLWTGGGDGASLNRSGASSSELSESRAAILRFGAAFTAAGVRDDLSGGAFVAVTLRARTGVLGGGSTAFLAFDFFSFVGVFGELRRCRGLLVGGGVGPRTVRAVSQFEAAIREELELRMRGGGRE